MKKMYLAIFLIILVVVVFAGCISFSNPIELTTAEKSNEYEDSYVTDTYAPEQNQGTNTPGSVDVTGEAEASEATSAGNNENRVPQGNVIENVQVPANNEYDILRGGSFYMKGSLVDSSGTTSPMEVAITPDTMFMLSDFSGAKMGLLIANDTVYMIYTDKQAYLELSDSIMSMAGLDISELTESDQINFASYGNLTDADYVTEESYNGHTCQVYHFYTQNGETRIFMDNASLLRIATFTNSGKLTSSTEVDEVSASVPADKKAPPSSYKKYKGMTGMFSFMTLLEGVVE